MRAQGDGLFRRILLPVDGSLCMAPLVDKCLAFAAATGAHVVAVHVLAPLDAGAPAPARVVAGAADDPLAHAARILQEVTAAARMLAVPCEARVLAGAEPWRAIVQAAIDSAADLICMGAHGRHGAAEQVLASQSARVLAHTRIPVLLFH